MNRNFWLILLMFFSATAVGAGWFAVNAPEASRPSFAALGGVRLTNEKPPLPPAPLSRPRGKGFEAVLRRPLFRPPNGGAVGSRQPVGAAAALGGKQVGRREVLAPVAPAPFADFGEVASSHGPQDDFQAAFGLEAPRHKQYFGAHLIPDDSRTTDGVGGSAAAIAALRPDDSGERILEPPPRISAPVPRPRPASRPRSAPRPQPDDNAPEAVAEAATRYDGGSAAAISGGAAPSPEDDIILLGVLLRRGKDRALVRLPSGESRRVQLGDDIVGWKVSQIQADSIQLKRASQTRVIKVPE